MSDEDGRDRHFQSEPSNGLPHRVIVSEMIGKGLKTADAAEGLGPERDGCARAGVGKTELQPHQGAWQKMLVNGRGGELRPKAT